MQELLENFDGVVDEELEEAIETIESYIGVEGYEWVSGFLDEIEDVAYLEGIAEQIEAQAELTEVVSEPFTEEDAVALKRNYTMLLDIAIENRQDIKAIKKMFLGDSADDEEDVEEAENEDY